MPRRRRLWPRTPNRIRGGLIDAGLIVVDVGRGPAAPAARGLVVIDVGHGRGGTAAPATRDLVVIDAGRVGDGRGRSLVIIDVCCVGDGRGRGP